MRKWNAILSAAILVLFLIHAVLGGFQLMGILPGGNRALSAMAYLMVGLIVVHGILGVKLTIDTCRACKRAGVSYFKDNKLFWTRRISGFAVFVLIFAHVILFLGRDSGGVYRLRFFGGLELATQLLLVFAVAVHVITNVKPVLIAFGIKSLKEYALDILFVLSVLLVFMGVAFLVYYFRWNYF
ncbi:MAG: pilus assembly protein PilX [Lachnospiraceae bacterium]|nr:pilus assembly protein PilX [Lachnospiraceae bacterium]